MYLQNDGYFYAMQHASHHQQDKQLHMQVEGMTLLYKSNFSPITSKIETMYKPVNCLQSNIMYRG
jgi:hypothetical protein